jgi:hypothetical protein
MSIFTDHLHFRSTRKHRTAKSHYVPRRRVYFEAAAEKRAREHL